MFTERQLAFKAATLAKLRAALAETPQRRPEAVVSLYRESADRLAGELHLAALPHAKAAPPWIVCGDRRSPDFGSVFAHKGARGGAALTFDRAGRHHALTIFNPADLPGEVEVEGRRFTVVDLR